MITDKAIEAVRPPHTEMSNYEQDAIGVMTQFSSISLANNDSYNFKYKVPIMQQDYRHDYGDSSYQHI